MTRLLKAVVACPLRIVGLLAIGISALVTLVIVLIAVAIIERPSPQHMKLLGLVLLGMAVIIIPSMTVPELLPDD